MPSTPARAQLAVFDPNNHSQNLLTAARTLQQINNQIQSFQNDATMILNQAKNLSRIDFQQLQNRLFDAAELRLGTKKQQIVRIERIGEAASRKGRRS